MTNEKEKNYYIKRKPKLMAQFDKFLNIAKDILIKKYSESKAEELIKQMRSEYEGLIPEIPYIGGKKNSFTSMLVEGVADLAMMRILEKEGLTYREIGEFTYEFFEIASQIRKKKLKKIGQNPAEQYFNKNFISYNKILATNSQKRLYPYDWVMEFIEGDGKTFDYSYKFSECGIHKVYKKLGAEKYTCFICLYDFATANIYEFGFKRTQTIGFGAPICDHQYIENGTTPRGWPPDNLQEFKKNLSK